MGMIGSTHFQLSSLEFKEFLPKLASESKVPIWHDWCGHTKEFKKLINEDLCDHSQGEGVHQYKKMGVFEESVNDHHDDWLVTCLWKPHDEIHRDIYPNGGKDGKRLECSLGFDQFSFVALAYITFKDKSANIPLYSWPKEREPSTCISLMEFGMANQSWRLQLHQDVVLESRSGEQHYMTFIPKGVLNPGVTWREIMIRLNLVDELSCGGVQ